MSNYYQRDKDGNWFVKHGTELTPVEFGASMEIAYRMGQIDELEETRRMMSEDIMLARNSQIRSVETAPV